MAYFRCTSGGSGKGNTVVVTCDSDFAGVTITCSKTGKTYSKVCPSTSPYTVTFYGVEAGTYTISAVVSGVTYSTEVIVQDISAVLNYGFNWERWVDTSSTLHSSDYADLATLLADEAAVRQLFTEHATVDYMASTANVTTDLTTILNDNYCAKWINLRDYALDTLYANAAIATAMNSADKYFYGEWVIIDNTTTPPTWGPKGNVPKMTSDTAPYGSAISSACYSGFSAYMAFNGGFTQSDVWHSSQNGAVNGYVGYKSTNPICVRKVSFRNRNNANAMDSVATFKIQGSNTGDSADWHDISDTLSNSNLSAAGYSEYELENTTYYLYHRLLVLTSYDDTNTSIQNKYVIINSLQFYGRELSVSVPKMTGNTTPYGEASASSASSGYEAYKAFDNDTSTYWNTQNPDAGINQHITYHFTTPIVPKFMYLLPMYASSQARVKNFTVRGSNDGFVNDSHDLLTDVFPNQNGAKCYELDVSETYSDIRLFVADNWGTADGRYIQITDLQFYGLDYSEKEFEEGATKKWLYDHGLELETINTDTTGGVVSKGVNSITMVNSAASYCGIGTDLMDTTSYDLFRCKLGDELVVGGQSRFGIMGVSSAVVGAANISSAAITADQAPNNMGLDISADDSNYSLVVYASNNGNKLSLKELWLE